jgi:hypothetical protein
MTTLTIVKGTTYEFPVTVTDEVSGAPIDLTGASLYVTVKQRPDDADPGLCQLSVGSGITVLAQSGGTLGQANVKFTPAQTGGFPAPAFLAWDCQYDSGGDAWTVASGIVATQERVTAHS